MAITLIESKTFNGSETTHTFSTISSSYKGLFLIGDLRSNRAAQASSGASIQFNSDTAANYAFERQIGTGAGGSASNHLAQTGFYLDIPAATAPAGEAASLWLQIPRPQSAFNKKVLYRAGVRTGTGASAHGLFDVAGWWLNTAALTSIRVYDTNSQNFTSGCGLDLFGIS